MDSLKIISVQRVVTGCLATFSLLLLVLFSWGNFSYIALPEVNPCSDLSYLRCYLTLIWSGEKAGENNLV